MGPWTKLVSFLWRMAPQLLLILCTILKQTETIVSFRRSQAKDILGLVASMNEIEAAECKTRVKVVTQALREY